MKTLLILAVVTSVLGIGLAVPYDQQDIEVEEDALGHNVADELESNNPENESEDETDSDATDEEEDASDDNDDDEDDVSEEERDNYNDEDNDEEEDGEQYGDNPSMGRSSDPVPFRFRFRKISRRIGRIIRKGKTIIGHGRCAAQCIAQCARSGR